MDAIMKAVLMVVDELGYDHPASIELDKANTDDEIRQGLYRGIEAIEKIPKIALAQILRDMLKGFL